MIANALTVDVAIPAAPIRTVVSSVRFATDPESSRYALGGCLLRIGQDRLTTIATDGRRMATRTVGAAYRAIEAQEILIGRDQYKALCAIGKTAGMVRLQSNGATACFSWRQRNGERSVDNPPPEKRFPRVDDILRGVRDRKPSYTLDVLAVSPDARMVDSVLLRPNGELSRRSSRLQVIAETGTPPQIAFDLGMLSEWLESIGDDKAPVRIEIGEPDAPIYAYVNRPKQSTVPAEYVQMPLTRDY